MIKLEIRGVFFFVTISAFNVVPSTMHTYIARSDTVLSSVTFWKHVHGVQSFIFDIYNCFIFRSCFHVSHRSFQCWFLFNHIKNDSTIVLSLFHLFVSMLILLPKYQIIVSKLFQTFSLKYRIISFFFCIVPLLSLYIVTKKKRIHSKDFKNASVPSHLKNCRFLEPLSRSTTLPHIAGFKTQYKSSTIEIVPWLFQFVI